MKEDILKELKHHAPFTAWGAAFGVLMMVIFYKLSARTSYTFFYILHPMHIFLSAFVTSSIFHLHKCNNVTPKCNFWVLLAVGYVGSIGIATLSDSLIPYLGEFLLDMPHRRAHIGFIEKGWLINPLAIAGVTLAYFKPRTKMPHAGHVLLSTWASLFHMMMAKPETLSWMAYPAIFGFLFLAVWIPCCVSDIVFPLVFIRQEKKK